MQNRNSTKRSGSQSSSLVANGNKLFHEGKLELAEACYKKAAETSPAISSLLEFNIALVNSRRKLLEEKGVYKREEIDPAEASFLGLASELYGSEPSTNVGKCEFRLESVGSKQASGWAVGLKGSGSVVLSTKINGKNYAVIETSSQRKDVQKSFGGDGFSGYKVELNEYLTYSNRAIFSVSPLSHVPASEPKVRDKRFSPILKGEHFVDPESVAKKVCSKYLSSMSSERQRAFTVSVIILNLNGCAVLKECVQSLLKYNDYSEIIVVDHASTDSSVEMLRGLSRPDRIKVIQRDKNYSYSNSNNFAAKNASGEVLVFLNNDIILTEDSISEMSKVLSLGEFGLVGLKLWDMPRGKGFALNESFKFPQHYGVNFRGVARNNTVEAFEVRQSSFMDYQDGLLEVPALTAAVMAMKKSDFERLGGFDEDYFYGQEDVDLCLRYGETFDKKLGVIVSQGAFHIRGLSRKTLSKSNKSYISDNRKYIQKKRGASFRRIFRKGQFQRPGFWNQKPLAVAMIVSEVGFETDKADFFTAKELGDSFQRDDIVVGYFDSKSNYDVSGYDVVMVFIDGFDPRRLQNISPHAKVIAWARNWFDRWCDRPWIEFYDCIYASSEMARVYMNERLKRSVGLLRIAASSACIKPLGPVEKYESDYVFTGSYFQSPREITESLDPESIPFKFKLFGHNWEGHEAFGAYTAGPVSYKDIPLVYASTSLVVDDANVATKQWGSLNCRFFDSLASGKLCITNNSIGVEEIFKDGTLIYSKENINSKVVELLNDKDRRLKLADSYRNEILKNHTYANRKETILSDIYASNNRVKIAIKIAAPDFERAVRWGDYHFAIALRLELEKLGYAVRIDCLNDWYGSRNLDDDVVVTLRGLDRYKVREDQLNILWLISHPDLVCEEEIRDYDEVFVASKKYTDKIRYLTELDNVHYLPQASSFSDLDRDILEKTPSYELLFVGNSRNQFRESVRFCVEQDLPLAVFGEGWEQFVPQSYIKGTYISNDMLPYYYANAKVVLNDHWDDMKRQGFVSNRVFDVMMVGGNVLTDYVEGMEENYFSGVESYRNKKDFLEKVNRILLKSSSYESPEEKGAPWRYSFSERAQKIDRIIRNYEGRMFSN